MVIEPREQAIKEVVKVEHIEMEERAVVKSEGAVLDNDEKSADISERVNDISTTANEEGAMEEVRVIQPINVEVAFEGVVIVIALGY